MNTNEQLFSPLDGDVSLQTRFGDSTGLISPILSPTYKHYDAAYQYRSPGPGARKDSIPRKPVPGSYAKLHGHAHTDSFNTMLTDNTFTTIEEEKREQDVVVKRGWRFYGTFACLALLNLICAIDATILSVALPVRPILLLIKSMLNIC
jgi:hypothetical protein